jgi:hypothetical protein
MMLDKIELIVAYRWWQGYTQINNDKLHLRRLGLRPNLVYSYATLYATKCKGPSDKLLNHLYHVDSQFRKFIDYYREKREYERMRRTVCGPWLEQLSLAELNYKYQQRRSQVIGSQAS